MKIALIGYGKMGHMIEASARERGHEIVSVIDIDNRADFASPEFASADVAIEFSRPDAARPNVEESLRRGVSVVSGTTGWAAGVEELKGSPLLKEAGFLWSSNFSIGVNLFRAVNRFAARLMSHFPQYSASVKEVHHIHKLDHPSGTAITIAEDLIANSSVLERWQEMEPSQEAQSDVLPIYYGREGEVPGIHTVRWDSEVDELIFTHSAKSRRGFALGAVMAAEWLHGKRGYHSIDDVMEGLTGSKGLFK